MAHTPIESPYLGIEVISRAVIVQDNQLLLCQAANKSHYYLPGGHVEFGETAQIALARELQEEIGLQPIKSHYIGTIEHLYKGSDGAHHEINLIFSVELPSGQIVSQEDHIRFIWQPIAQLSAIQILPEHLAAATLTWLRDQQPFWQPATLV